MVAFLDSSKALMQRNHSVQKGIPRDPAGMGEVGCVLKEMQWCRRPCNCISGSGWGPCPQCSASEVSYMVQAYGTRCQMFG